MKVGVIRGGVSTEREVSLATGQEIINNLDREKYEVVDIVVNSEKEVYEKLSYEKFDFVYIALHGKFGEDGKIQSILESLDIPYSGGGILSSAGCMDKDITKRIVSSYGVRVSKGMSLRKGQKISFDYIKEILGDKVVVKPNSGGSSIGVSFVTNQEELSNALSLVFSIDKEAMIEEVLYGEEITVPIIDGVVYPTVKIEALAGEYFDYNSKYSEGGAREYVHQYPDLVQKEINKLAMTSYYGMKCEGFARIDFILVNGDTPYFMEINTLPGMTSASLLPKSTASKGLSYSQTLDLLIQSSLKINR